MTTALAPPKADLMISLSSSFTPLFLSQSLDELDDDDAGEKERREEEELVQANTYQNEAMTADPTTGQLMVRSDVIGGRRRLNVFSLTLLVVCGHVDSLGCICPDFKMYVT